MCYIEQNQTKLFLYWNNIAATDEMPDRDYMKILSSMQNIGFLCFVLFLKAISLSYSKQPNNSFLCI